jgi:hypothetical protein
MPWFIASVPTEPPAVPGIREGIVEHGEYATEAEAWAAARSRHDSPGRERQVFEAESAWAVARLLVGRR